MSDTPRTDARVRMIIDNDGSAEGLEIFARQLERELNEAKRGAARYEVVRKMNATDFALLHQRCIHMDLRFDDEVDKLYETRTIKMHLNLKKDEKP